MNLREYFRGLPLGGLLVVEYSSRSPFAEVFHTIAGACDMPILIADVFDTFLPVKRTLDVAGKDVSYLERADFIKGGGRILWPNTLRVVNVYRDVGLYLREVAHFLKKYYEEHPGTCSFFFGVERLQRISPEEARFLLNVYGVMTTFVGSKERTAVHFVNTDIADGRYVGLAEEVATRVLAVRKGFVEVLKSPGVEERGLKLTF
ncbi:DUF257 family protein [Palaeococcus ferrophilus]|uniref:DUF257 family protein n=1 Tax=Palaeococcus ferrophilus TaxID=83868 RepID=UPI00064F0929|nr:DUF257 family protein [Palaeococcus ferrophilus]